MLALLSLLLVQAAQPSLEQDRLTVCLDQARTDPATAITTADEWLAEASGAGRSAPQQCLGTAYVSLLRWDAARDAFMGARDARAESEGAARARLGAMAGNAALAGRHAEEALAMLDQALADARGAGQVELAGTISADRAKALVALGRQQEAVPALDAARRDAPQQAAVWLLSATLARRMEQLDQAQSYIQTAATLTPDDPAIGLEAGLIAALSGRDDAARASWRSVIDRAPGSPPAKEAAEYLAQLDGAPPSR